MMIINPLYKIGSIVYIKTDEDQKDRMVYCYKIYQNDILYELTCGTLTSAHYDFELSVEKDILKSVTH